LQSTRGRFRHARMVSSAAGRAISVTESQLQSRLIASVIYSFSIADALCQGEGQG
jgi:hypothetical protein